MHEYILQLGPSLWVGASGNLVTRRDCALRLHERLLAQHLLVFWPGASVEQA